jgi:hypothetical protein
MFGRSWGEPGPVSRGREWEEERAVRVCVWHRMSVPAPGVPDAPRGGVSPPDARNGSVYPLDAREGSVYPLDAREGSVSPLDAHNGSVSPLDAPCVASRSRARSSV